MSGIALETLRKSFQMVSEISSRHTRSHDEEKLYAPKFRLEMTKRSFGARPLTAWNNLPLIVKTHPPLNISRKH